MKLFLIGVLLTLFVSWAYGKVLSDPVISYENYQVLRVQINSKEKFDVLSAINGIHFWNEGRIGGNADVMVAPNDIIQVREYLLKQGFKFREVVKQSQSS